jgi:hypothetical protein
MIYLALTSSIEAGAATSLVLRYDDGHDSEDEDSYYYDMTIDEMTPPDGDDASKMVLPILGSLPMAAEELDMEAYPILSQLPNLKSTVSFRIRWVARVGVRDQTQAWWL